VQSHLWREGHLWHTGLRRPRAPPAKVIYGERSSMAHWPAAPECRCKVIYDEKSLPGP
jgi:hypothetical protein